MKATAGGKDTVGDMQRVVQSIPSSYTVWKDGTQAIAESNVKGGTDYTTGTVAVVIQNAIDALPAKGGSIAFREGDLTLASEVVCNKPVLIRGAGFGLTEPVPVQGVTTITFGNHTAFKITNRSVQIENLNLVGGGKALASGKALYFNGVGQPATNRVGWANCVRNIAITNCYDPLYLDGDIFELSLDHIYTKNCQRGFYADTDSINAYLNRVCVISCGTVAGAAADAFYVKNMNALFMDDCQAFGGDPDSNMDYGLHLVDIMAGNQVFKGIQMDGCNKAGLYVDMPASRLVQIEVLGSWFHAKENAVLIKNATDISIVGGMAYVIAGGTPDSIIKAEDSAVINISDVKVRQEVDAAILGIELHDTTQCSVFGNFVYNYYAPGAALNDHVIQETGTTCDWNKVIGNTVRWSAGEPVDLYGAYSMKLGNPHSKNQFVRPVIFNNDAGVEKGAISTGTAGNRMVLKFYDVTLTAWRYAYIDNGAWVIAVAEPT